MSDFPGRFCLRSRHLYKNWIQLVTGLSNLLAVQHKNPFHVNWIYCWAVVLLLTLFLLTFVPPVLVLWWPQMRSLNWQCQKVQRTIAPEWNNNNNNNIHDDIRLSAFSSNICQKPERDNSHFSSYERARSRAHTNPIFNESENLSKKSHFQDSTIRNHGFLALSRLC